MFGEQFGLRPVIALAIAERHYGSVDRYHGEEERRLEPMLLDKLA
jgi:hypothetical protein